jgi:tetratricopeptide (TPR) repeat protein
MTLNSHRAWFTVARVFAKSMRATAALMLLAAILTVTGDAQAPDPYQVYRAAVAAYAKTGNITRTATPLQNWSGKEFDAAVKATLAARIPEELEAAAIFHLEIAMALVGMSSGVAAGHINYGAALLDRWTATQPALKSAAVTDQQRFRSIWFGVAGSAFAAIKELGHARPLLNRALNAEPRSARAKTLLGTLKEFEASQYNPDDAATVNLRERTHRERLALLYLAEQEYRAALRYDPNYALAHIRLGHVLHLADKKGEARATLERGLSLANEPLTQYLGALYMGALQQDEKDLAGARRSFERAVTIVPNSQPAIVALAHMEVMAGRPDRAHALARGLAEAQATGEPWWAFHHGGVDVVGLRWLRERVLQ